jgi:hypothetical protein
MEICADVIVSRVFTSQLISYLLYPIAMSRVTQVGWSLGFSLWKNGALLGYQAGIGLG